MDRSIIEQYAKGAGLVAEAIKGLSGEDFLATPVPKTWSIGQIVMHLLDSDLIASDRMKRIIAEENPAIIGYDETAFAARLFYEKQDFALAAEVFRLNRQLTAVIFRNLPDSSFLRVGTHNERGVITVAGYLKSTNDHLDRHIDFIHKKRAHMGKEMW